MDAFVDMDIEVALLDQGLEPESVTPENFSAPEIFDQELEQIRAAIAGEAPEDFWLETGPGETGGNTGISDEMADWIAEFMELDNIDNILSQPEILTEEPQTELQSDQADDSTTSPVEKGADTLVYNDEIIVEGRITVFEGAGNFGGLSSVSSSNWDITVIYEPIDVNSDSDDDTVDEVVVTGVRTSDNTPIPTSLQNLLTDMFSSDAFKEMVEAVGLDLTDTLIEVLLKYISENFNAYEFEGKMYLIPKGTIPIDNGSGNFALLQDIETGRIVGMTPWWQDSVTTDRDNYDWRGFWLDMLRIGVGSVGGAALASWQAWTLPVGAGVDTILELRDDR